MSPTEIHLTAHLPTRGNCLEKGSAYCFEIVQELVRSLRAGELSDELIAKVDTIPKEIDKKLSAVSGELPYLIRMVQGCNVAPDIRQEIVQMMQDEIEWIEQETGSRVEDLIPQS